MQVLGYPIAWNCHVEIVCPRQIAASFFIQPAIAGEGACNLANAVSSKVEADTGVVVADGRQWLALLIHTNERHYEFIGHTFVVEILHALHGIGILPAFAIAEYHGIEGFGDSLPPAVTIHRVVASTHARDLTRVVLTLLLQQLLQIAGAAGGQRIAPIHECMHEDTVHIILLRHLQKSVKVGLM